MIDKRILIISRSFPPYIPTLGGAIRILKLCEFLLQEGYEVYVLAAKGEFINTFGYDELLNKIKIEYIDDKLQKYICNEEKNKSNGSKNKIPVDTFLSRVKKHLKKNILKISVPDLGVFFYEKFFRRALEIIKKNNIRNVLVSTPPHSDLLIGYKLKLKLKTKIRFIIDYRDSWNCSPLFSKRNFFLNIYSNRMEMKILSVADNFTFISEPMLEKLLSKFPEIKNFRDKSTLIMNGFDEKHLKLVDNNIISCEHNEIRIGYFGAMDDRDGSYRNPSAFFETVSKIEWPIKIIIYGPVHISEYWHNVLGDKLEVHNSISHREAIKTMQTMDILMLLISMDEGTEEIITGKVFDYMVAGKEILCVGPKNMAVCEIIENEGIGRIVYYKDQGEILRNLEEIYYKGAKGYAGRDFLKYSRQNQYKKFLSILARSTDNAAR